MPQVRKPEVERHIHEAALLRFAQDGIQQTSMAAIAATAGVSAGNLYRYHPDGKQALLNSVLPRELAERFDRLVTDRVRALPLGADGTIGPSPEADELLSFWIAHRLEVVILLTRATGTRYAGFPERFEQLLVDLGVERLEHAGVTPTADDRVLLSIVMANTRVALAQILLRFDDARRIRRAIEGFWSYQLPGLNGLHDWLRTTSGSQASP